VKERNNCCIWWNKLAERRTALKQIAVIRMPEDRIEKVR